MQQFIYTIHDEKAKAFFPPFVLSNDEIAKRTFSDCINSDTHQMGKNPDDYTLFKLGSFDDNTAEIKNEKMMKSLGNGVVFIKADKGGKQVEIKYESNQEENNV